MDVGRLPIAVTGVKRGSQPPHLERYPWQRSVIEVSCTGLRSIAVDCATFPKFAAGRLAGAKAGQQGESGNPTISGFRGYSPGSKACPAHLVTIPITPNQSQSKSVKVNQSESKSVIEILPRPPDTGIGLSLERPGLTCPRRRGRPLPWCCGRRFRRCSRWAWSSTSRRAPWPARVHGSRSG